MKKKIREISAGLLLMLLAGMEAGAAQTEPPVTLPAGVRVDSYNPYTQVTVEYPVLETVSGVSDEILQTVNTYFYTEAIADGDEQAAYASQDREALMDYQPDLVDSVTYETTVDKIGRAHV